MKKVFIFKNLGTGQVKNVLAEDGNGKTALDNAIEEILTKENWRVEEVKFIGSRKSAG